MARVDCNGVNHLSRPHKAGKSALNPSSPLDSNVLVGLDPTCLMPGTFSLCRDGFVADVLLLRCP